MKTNNTTAPKAAKTPAGKEGEPKTPVAVVEIAEGKNAPGERDTKVPAFTLNETDISIVFAPGISPEEWKDAGARLAAMGKVASFALGDWLKFGKSHFPNGFKTASEITGLSHGYLKNTSSIANAFPPGKRYPALSIEHHRLLKMIPDAKTRDEVAQKAIAEKQTAGVLRNIVADKKGPKPPEAPLTPEQIAAKHAIQETEHLANIDKALAFLKENPAACDAEMWRNIQTGMIATVDVAEKVWQAKGTPELAKAK